MMTDPIADMITRIRNANAIGRRELSMPSSKLKLNLAAALKREGYLLQVEEDLSSRHPQLKISINIGPNGEKSFREISRISKPGCRVYSSINDLKPVRRGMGNVILSTSKGVLSDREARKENVGGECLVRIL
jgi:small subunit ribosomal protein S8